MGENLSGCFRLVLLYEDFSFTSKLNAGDFSSLGVDTIIEYLYAAISLIVYKNFTQIRRNVMQRIKECLHNQLQI